ncbi:transposase [Streptomyces avermitilis]|uniref:transposase n=1 Tax=Streptomyces avermitilis TaxID=33903 RepID=UPI0036C3514C
MGRGTSQIRLSRRERSERISLVEIVHPIGDDRTRFADARGLKAYAGSAPVTRASGKSVLFETGPSEVRYAVEDGTVEGRTPSPSSSTEPSSESTSKSSTETPKSAASMSSKDAGSWNGS